MFACFCSLSILPLFLKSYIYIKVFAGRDASRALATFSVEETLFKDEYDDLVDLTPSQMASVKEWEMQFLGLLFLIFIQLPN